MKVELPAVVDPVGEALHFLRMSGTFYCRSEFGAPWALAIPPMENCLMLHVAAAGKYFLEVEGASSGPLQSGDLVDTVRSFFAHAVSAGVKRLVFLSGRGE